jgi:small GTP-binding protein
MTRFDNLLKVIVIGDTQVGKTQMMLRFVDGVFSDTALTTVGVDFKCKVIELQGNEKFKLQIWDTAGQERFRVITENYYRKADGVAIVFDVTKRESFQHVQSWSESVKQSSNAHIPAILVGNKCDLELRIEPSEAEELARRLDVPLFYTSAKNGTGIDDAFVALAEAVRIAKKTTQPVSSTSVALPTKPGKNGGKRRCCK